MPRFLPHVLAIGLTFGAAAFAADDPSIGQPVRGQVQASMKALIETGTVDGVFRHYDPVTDQVFDLTFSALHDGIVRKGDYYVSCADFTDAEGNEVDVDFLVLPDGDGVRAVQAILHKVDGAKRPYHLEG